MPTKPGHGYERGTMTTRTRNAPQRTALPAGFAPKERAAVEEFAKRLIDELRESIGRVRKPGMSVLALSRELKIHRNLCQRVASTLESRLTPTRSLAGLPGPDGLRLFAKAITRALGTSEKRAPLILLADRYEALINESGGSQAKFLARVDATEHTGSARSGTIDEVKQIRVRRLMHRHAAELMGCELDAFPLVNIVRPIPDTPELIEGVQGHAWVRFRNLGSPLVTIGRGHQYRNHSVGETTQEIKSTPLGDTRNDAGLLEEFCTKPAPRAIFDDSDGVSRILADTSHSGENPIDLALARHWTPGTNPLFDSERSWTQNVMVGRPTSRVLIDVYLHRSLAALCIPSAAAFLWSPGLEPTHNKHARLPVRLTVEVLGAGTDAASSTAWERHHAFTERLFELSGWSPCDFIGFRCDVRDAIWGATYFMILEFESSMMSPSPRAANNAGSAKTIRSRGARKEKPESNP